MILEGLFEVIGVVDFGAAGFVEFPGGFAAGAGSEIEFGAAVSFSPGKHGFPKFAANALAAARCVGDKIFEIGDFSDNWPHDDGKSGDALDFAGIVDGEEHIVIGGSDEFVEPFARDFAAIFAGTRKLN